MIIKTEHKEQQYLGANGESSTAGVLLSPYPERLGIPMNILGVRTFGWVLAICLKTGFLLVSGGKVKDWFAENFLALLCYGEEEIED